MCCKQVHIILDEDRSHCKVVKSGWSKDERNGPSRPLFIDFSGSHSNRKVKSETGKENSSSLWSHAKDGDLCG